MSNLISINLGSSVAPKIQEVRGRDYIEYSDEDGVWKNLYPNFLIDLYYNSSTHAAIVNSTSEMIAGSDIVIDDEEDINLEAVVKLKKFLKNINGKESAHQIIKKVAFDFKLQGAYALHCIYNQDLTEIVQVFHVPVERIRAGRPNSLGKIDTYYISADWSNVRSNKPMPIAAFDTHNRSTSQLIYTGSYSPNMDVYFTPDSLAGNNWSLIESKISEYHLNNISNGFSGSYMFSFNNGVPTKEGRNEIERDIKAKLTGSGNAGTFLMNFADGKERGVEVTPMNAADLSEQYITLQNLIVQNILTSHRVTSKTLLGIDSSDGFSSSADELAVASNFYLNQVIVPFQLNILDTLQSILAVNDIDLPVKFVQLKPITIQFDSETVREVMTTSEIRADLGLPDLTEQEVEEDFSTELSIEKNEEVQLDSWIQEFGEDTPEEWELIEEEVVDGEHNDFDFEQELNEIANEKLKLASTVKATPNKRSEQDGVNKSFNDYYKVRYEYATDNFLTNKSGESRSFCKKMVSAKKLYTKEDLVNADSLTLNKGFGIDGTQAYNLFLFKGGPQCRHFFNRLIFKTSLRAAKSKISDSQLIGYTKARSEGFTAEKNDKRVAMAPQRMKNNGYNK
jgi:hypothetical protein